MYNVKDELSKLGLVASSETDYELNQKINLFTEVLALDTDQNQK